MSSRAYVRAAFDILPLSARRKLWVVVVVLAAISILDLLALVLVLGITAIGSSSGPDGKPSLEAVPSWVRTPLESLGLSSVSSVVSALGLSVVILFVGKAVLASAVLRTVLRSLARHEARLTHDLMRKLMRAPLTFHLPRRYIDVMSDITVGAECLIMKAVAPTIMIAAELVLIVMLIIGLVVLAPLVALGSVLYFSVVLTLLNRWIGRRAAAAGEVDVEATRSGMIVIQWALGGYREVVARGVSDHFVDRVGDIRRRGSTARAEVAYLNVVPRYFLESSLVVGMAFAFAVELPFVGFAKAVSGLALFAVAGFRLLPSLQRLQSSAALISNGQPFGERALAIIEQIDAALAVESARGVHDGAAASNDSVEQEITLHEAVEVERLSFRYDGATDLALDSVDARLPAGQMTALVGASGSGKSTFIDVLLGLLPPTSGEVLIDGQPLRLVRKSWLQIVGYVPQSVFLMPATIRENVALGVAVGDIDEDAVWAALTRASLDETIRSLPGELDYKLGDAGSGLSGGQRQRLGIARALYHRPLVLILDEATSALDVETEAEITTTLTSLDGLTKIVVAHRLSTVRHADKVLFFRDGHIVASGSFDEVRAAVPDFARQVQLSGLSPAQVTT